MLFQTIFYTLPRLACLADDEWIQPQQFVQMDHTWEETGQHLIPLRNSSDKLASCKEGAWRMKAPSRIFLVTFFCQLVKREPICRRNYRNQSHPIVRHSSLAFPGTNVLSHSTSDILNKVDLPGDGLLAVGVNSLLPAHLFVWQTYLTSSSCT